MLAATVTRRWSTAMFSIRRIERVIGRMQSEKSSSGNMNHHSHGSGPARCLKYPRPFSLMP